MSVPAAALRAAAHELDEFVRTLSESIHRAPEIGLVLPRTVETIVRSLAGLPLEVRRGTGIDSVVAVIGRDRPGGVTVLHADTDALPIQEADDHAVRSEIPGAMHACGHDLHAAMLVGAAHVVARFADALPGPVVFVWQPGEEGHDGMQAMIDEGLLDLIDEIGPARRTYGLHVLADRALPVGVFAGRVGVSHAATASFEIAIVGSGGHAGFPHQARDPIPVAAETITALYTAYTRAVDPLAPGVLTVGRMHAGHAANVIADTATIGGTVRTYAADVRDTLGELLTRVPRGIAAAHGLRAVTRVVDEYPTVVNDADAVASLRSVVTAVVGDDRLAWLDAPLPAGDDYGRLMQRIPGAYFMLGAGHADPDGTVPPNHSAGVRFDPGVLADGVAVLAAAAFEPALE